MCRRAIFYRSVLPSYYIQTTHNIIINYALSGSKHVCLFRDNALSHIYNYINKLVNFFLKLEKVTILTHPQYSLNLVPCDLLFFIKHIHFWCGHCYKSRRPPVKARPPVRALELYINKLTATYFRKKRFRDWNYVFWTGKTLKECNVHFTSWVKCFWDTISYNIICLSNNPLMYQTESVTSH